MGYKSKFSFDTTDANTIAESDSLGAFLRSSDGTLITHTTVSGKEALDVRLAEGVNVEVDLSHVDDSIRLGDGSSFFTSTSENSDIALDVHISNTSIDVGTVTTLTGITNDVSIDDGGNSITVDAVNLDIRDLTAASDSVESHTHDGTGTAITSTAGALDVNIASGSITTSDAALANTAIANAANTLAVAATAEDIVAAPLANRKYLHVYNNDNRTMYIGSTGVTAANGFPVDPGTVVSLRAGAAVDIEYVSPKLAHEIRTMELS